MARQTDTRAAARIWERDREPDTRLDQPSDHRHSHEPLRVPAIGLDPIPRWALDLARGRHHAPDPGRHQRARARTRSAPPRRPRAPARAARRRTPSPQPSNPASDAPSSPQTRRRPRTPPPSRRVRPGRPRCEPWSRSAPPIWGCGPPRGGHRARLRTSPTMIAPGTGQLMPGQPEATSIWSEAHARCVFSLCGAGA